MKSESDEESENDKEDRMSTIVGVQLVVKV